MIEKNTEKNDLKIILVGFSFVVAVSVLFFLKFHFIDQKKQAALEDAAQKNAIDATKKFSSITSADLAKKISAKEALLILDLRESDSFNAEHILDAKNLTLDSLTENITAFDKHGEYVFVDDLGLTPNEIQAMQIFENNGITSVTYLEGGITQWKNEYEPTIDIGDPYSLVDRSKTLYIKSDDLQTAISNKEYLYLIDVRSSDEYKNGHIAGAVNIYLDDLENRRREIPLGTKIVLYDDNGVGAFQGAARLFDAGILNVYTLSDGLNAWKQKKFPLTMAQ